MARNILKHFFLLLKNNHTVSLISSVTVSGLDALTILILSWMFSLTIMGDWSICMAGVLFFDMLRSGLIFNGLIKFISGGKPEDKKQYIGSAFIIVLILNIVFIALFYGFFFSFRSTFNLYDFSGLFIFAPLFSLASLPLCLSIFIAQSEENFKRIAIIRIISSLTFIILVTIYTLFDKRNITYIYLFQLMGFVLSSLVCLVTNWSGIKYIFSLNREKISELLHFGKFSVGMSIGSHLLKSADIFLIGFFLGREEVALYSIPLKLIEIINIPLNSIVAVLYPKVSKSHTNNRMRESRQYFYLYWILLTLLFIPFIIALFFLAKQCVYLLGGPKYIADTVSTHVFKIFLVYSLFLPTDRCTGTVLDGIKKPQYTFYKVLILVGINTIGDIIALYYFKSLEAVAIITIINVIFGSLLGVVFVRKFLKINIEEALYVIKEFFSSIKSKMSFSESK